MASEKIDELQLQIGSDASGAIKQIGNIASALDIAAASAQRFASASTLLNRFASGMERLANVDLNNAISGLQTLSKLDLSNLKDKKVNIDLTVNGADRVDRIAYASDQAAKSMSKNASDMAKTLGQEYKMPTKAVTELTGLVKDYLKALSIGDTSGVMDAITSHIESNTRKSAADIMGVTNQYKSFLDYVNNMKISPGSNTDSNTRDLFTALGLERQLENGATSIDTWWQEDSFKAVAAGIGDTLIDLAETNPENMFLQLAGAVDYCRTALNTYWSDAETTAQINENVGQSLDGLRDAYNEKVNKNMATTKNAIPLDLSVDKARFHKNIQDAIYEVTKLPFKSHPITVELNTQQLKQNLEHVISLVDFGKMPQTAQGFKDMSDAIASMNQASMKDTGVTQFTNAMARLMKVDTSKFDVATLGKIIDHIKEMTAIGNIPNSINRFVSALARLASAGDKTKKSADGMKVLSVRLVDTVKSLIGVGEINPTISQFVSSLAKLATAGDKTAKTASNLKALTTAVVDFINSLKNAPEINDNLAMTINGLGNLASAGAKTGKALSTISSGSGGFGSFGTAIGSASHVASNGLKKLLNVSLSLGGRGASALGSFMGRLGLIPHHTANVNRMALTFGNLLRAVIPFYGLRGIFDWAKNSFELGSSIVEIQNVVDTAFGSLKRGYEDISGYIYKWSKTTIDSFGVSELAALQYAGRLQSIFNSSGFDVTEGMRDSAAKMSTDLIERAGDIASFYDITVDEAMTKITSGLAGMSRPLRSLGVNMSVANLEAFALSQGITTSWKSMDQATQMALRYQYILNATQYTEGDFGRTAMSAANQVRLLQLNMQVLSSTIGQGFVSAIAPAISWLNALIRRLIQAANAFRTFMWTLFGKPLAAARGFSDDLAGYLDDSADAVGDLGSGAGGASDGLGKAGKAAKELKKQLTVLPFDELNQLAKDTDSASSGGSGGSGGGGGGGLGGLDTSGLIPDFTADLDNSPFVDAINKWAKRIRKAFIQRDWQGLGKNIAYALNAGFAKIYEALDWSNWRDRVYGFIQPFQASVNSMMEYIDWGLIGRTLARGLNNIVYTFRMWINGFNWRQWGKRLAFGANSMLDEWDADAFGRLIADKFRAAWNFFGGWVEQFNFAQLGTKLKEMILGGLSEMNWSDMGESLGGFLNGISDTINEMLGDGQVRDELADAFSEFVNSFLEEFDEEDAKEALKNIGDTIFGGIKKAFEQTDKSELVGTVITVLSGLPWGAIAIAIGVKAGGAFAKGIFGAVFKSKAQEIISGIHFGGSGAKTTGATAGAAAGATTAGAAAGTTTAGAAAGATTANKSGIVNLGTITAVTLGVTAITLGGIALGKWLDKKLRKMFPTYGKAADAQKNAKESGATGSSTSYSDVWKDFGKYTPGGGTQAIKPSAAATNTSTTVTQFIETILTGKKDASFANLEHAKASLLDTPIVQKIMNGSLTSAFKDGYKKFTDTKAYNTVKGFGASISSTFQTWWGRNIDKKNYTSTKSMGASIGSAFQTWWGRNTDQKNYKSIKGMDASPTSTLETWWGHFVDTGHYLASKWFTATDKGNFSKYTDMWKNLKDKWVDVNVSIVKKTSDLGAWIKGKWEELVRFDWFAKGGLFQSTSLIGVGEAGAEAVLPLTNRRTMKMIGSAISNAGGMSVGGNAELANEIAMRIAPIIISAINSQNQRPINVNATLYTENNEVLAKAVNRGNRSLDKRYHPVAQYSY